MNSLDTGDGQGARAHVESDSAPELELWAAPDEFARGAEAWLGRVLKEWARELHPVLGLLGSEKVSDLPTQEEIAHADPELTSPLFRAITVAVDHSLSFDEVLTFDVSATLARFFEIADDWGGQLTRGVLGHISDVSDEYGQSIDGSGRDFFDVLIEAFESLEVTFDGDGEPEIPTLVVGPGVMDKMRTGSMTPDQERRMAKAMARKREEHRAAQRRPELP